MKREEFQGMEKRKEEWKIQSKESSCETTFA